MNRKKLVQNVVVGTLFLVVVVFGIIPIVSRGDRDLERFGYKPGDAYDVVVLGSEPEAIAAAVAAARTGVEVLLAAPGPDTGSYLTDCLIHSVPHQTGTIAGKPMTLTGPVFADLFGKSDSTFTSSDWMKASRRLLSLEPDLLALFDATVTGVKTDGRRVTSLELFTPDGKRTVRASVFIDATEDGVLLERLGAAHLVGSEDVGAPEFFEPVSFGFRLRGVSWDDIKTIAKVKDLSGQFADMLYQYPRTDESVKLVSPSMIRQQEDTIQVNGLQIGFVNPGSREEVAAAYQTALREAMHLAAYLQTELVPFAGSDWDVGADRLYIQEYRHYRGMETLTVGDVLENRDRKDKIALLSDPVSAARFVRGDDPAILCDPDVYAVPLGALVPVAWDNVLMPGRNASYASLASSSAATPSARAVVGEGAGLAAAWCALDKTDPAAVPTLPDDRLAEFRAFIARAGQVIPDFSEPLRLSDNTLFADAWMADDIRTLVSYGILRGGTENDFRLDTGCSGQVLAVLAKNALLRLAPDRYGLDLDERVTKAATGDPVTADGAARILLALAGVEAGSRDASTALFAWLGEDGAWTPSAQLLAEWPETGTVRNGPLYHLVTATCRKIAAAPVAD